MAGALLERELTRPTTRRVSFELARAEDDPAIRRLLRESPMAGHISVSLEREPKYFADAHLPGQTKQTIIARDREHLLAMGSCTVRRRYVNGVPVSVGYLGGLRLSGDCSGRLDILRGGYEFFRELQSEKPAEFYFTSIASDNERARRFLERNARGMPQYEFIGDFVSLLLSTCAAGPSAQGNNEAFSTKLVHWLNEQNEQYQFAPYWSAGEFEALKQLGLSPSDFSMLRKDASFAAIWDQRCFKQTVVRDYPPALKTTRHMLNAVRAITRQPRLPAIGETVSQAFVSFLALAGSEQETLIPLVHHLRSMAYQRGIEMLTVGFAASDPRLNLVRQNFRCPEYHSRIYLVRWPALGRPASDLDGRILAPELALL